MKELILPGSSAKNGEWASSVQCELTPLRDFLIIAWPHWQNPDKKFSADEEAEKLVKSLGSEEVKIIAKSVGTLVAVKAIASGINVVNLILCGVPLRGLDEDDKNAYEVLSVFPGKVVVFQNKDDNHGTWDEVVVFLKGINPNIEVVKKDRNDHEYPYAEDIKNFLE